MPQTARLMFAVFALLIGKATMTKSGAIVFTTSIYGRFGHCVMALAGFMIAAMTGVPIFGPLQPIALSNPWFWGTLLGFALGVWLCAYSLWFAVAFGERITFTRTHLIYRGFKRVSIAWCEIAALRLNYGGRSPFVYLSVRTQDKRWRNLNISGLDPNYEVVFAVAQRMAASAVTKPACNLGLTDALVQQIADL